jgi:hypothetical protein
LPPTIDKTVKGVNAVPFAAQEIVPKNKDRINGTKNKILQSNDRVGSIYCLFLNLNYFDMYIMFE